MKEKNRGEGYCPHEGMGYFTCERCGNDTFVAYPQAAPVTPQTWTYEHYCAKCGHMMGLTIVREEK